MRLAIFCGASQGNSPVIVKAVKELGAFLALNNVGIVYGGGNVGLMGNIADAALANNGEVIGVIPERLTHQEIAHPNLTELHIVAGMHERKAKIAQLADAFVALPGGIGTLEEIFETWTWGQLGYHQKPCAFYNVENFYDPLLSMVNSMHRAGFVRSNYLEAIITPNSPAELMTALKKYNHPQ
jgi:uncharacterized protein (TIGR00730 family)